MSPFWLFVVMAWQRGGWSPAPCSRGSGVRPGIDGAVAGRGVAMPVAVRSRSPRLPRSRGSVSPSWDSRERPPPGSLCGVSRASKRPATAVDSGFSASSPGAGVADYDDDDDDDDNDRYVDDLSRRVTFVLRRRRLPLCIVALRVCC